MNDLESPTFGALEVIEITGKFEADDDAFIIGGQATNFWAWFYQEKEPELKGGALLTSKDIDCFGTQDVARHVAEALGGKLILPKPGDHTPSTAQIVTAIHGKPLVIDFLGAVLGIHDRELRRGVSTLEVGAELDGKQTTVLVKVLHPLLCLKSRLVNMIHPAMRRQDAIARAQDEAAVIVVRRYIHPNEWREVHGCLRQLFQYLRSDQYVKVADIQIGIDPLKILKSFADDARIDRRYRNLTIKRNITKIERRRKNRR